MPKTPVTATVEFLQVLRFGQAWEEGPELQRAPALVCCHCGQPIHAEDSGLVVTSSVDESHGLSEGVHLGCAVSSVGGES